MINRDAIIRMVQKELLMHDGFGNFKIVTPTGRFTEYADSPTWPRYNIEVRLGLFAGKKWVPAAWLQEIQEARK